MINMPDIPQISEDPVLVIFYEDVCRFYIIVAKSAAVERFKSKE